MSGNRRDEGFTLVELMVVVLIIGILVSIAVPVFFSASANAAAKSCQANQRTILSAVQVYISDGDTTTAASDGQLAPGGSGWYGLLVPTWIQTQPTCPTKRTNYLLTAAGDVTGDTGGTSAFNEGHELPQ